MTDTKPAKPSWAERIRAGLTELLDSLGMEDGSEIEPPADEPPAEAPPADEPPADEPPADAPPADAPPADAPPADEPPAEGTPGASEEGDAELADLRAQVIEQAALIETQRNALAQAGIDLDAEIEPEPDEPAEEVSEEDAIAAFEEDYAVQAANLAKIKES